MRKARARLLPGVGGLFGGALLLALLAAAVNPMQDPDFFWHLRVGDWIMAHQAIPHHDLFTYTIGDRPWVAHEWLTELVVAALFRNTGLGGVVAAYGALVWLGFLLMYRAPRPAHYLLRGAALLVCVAVAAPILGPRTQMVTFTMSAAVVLLLRRYRQTRSRRWLYPLPALFGLWANSHAGFLVGLAILAIFAVGEAATIPAERASPLPVLAALAASAVAALINPNGPGIYTYTVQALNNSALQRLVDEWKSPDFHSASSRPLAFLLLLLLVLLARYGSRLRRSDLLLLLAGIFLALSAQRHMALLAVLAMPVLVDLLGGMWEEIRTHLPNIREPASGGARGLINLAVVALVGLLVALTLAPRLLQSPRGRIVRTAFPLATVDKLEGNLPPGRVFNAFGWGGYLAYRLPSVPVYIYGETELEGDALLSEYESIVTLHADYAQRLEARQVDWVIYPSNAPLAVALSSTPEWAVLHDDGQAVVLVRRGDRTRAFLAANGIH